MNIPAMLESFSKLKMVYHSGCYIKDYHWGIKFSDKDPRLNPGENETCVLASKTFSPDCRYSKFDLQVVIEGNVVFDEKDINEELFHKMVVKTMMLIYEHLNPDPIVKETEDNGIEEKTENTKNDAV